MSDGNTPRYQLIGAAWVFSGAVLFSTKAVLVKLAYRHDVDSVSLLALRMLFALPLYLVIARWSNHGARRMPVERGLLWKTFGFGLMGFYLASFFDFLGLRYLSAGMERIILFLYPTLVLFLSAVFLGKRITPVQVGAVALSYLGVAIAFLGVDTQSMSNNFYLGGGLVFLSALTYAIYLMGTGELVPKLGTFRFTAYAMLAATVGVLTQQLVVNGFALFDFHPLVYLYGGLMGLFATVLPSFMFSEGIRRIGSGNAAIISSVGPFSTIVLEYLFLEERFGGWQWLGAVLVVSGVLLISLSKNRS